jgi:fumarylacetoacetate (FAA) hydrolase
VKLATLKNERRDGALVVVSRDLSRFCDAADIAPNLQYALDRWAQLEAALQERDAELEAGEIPSEPFDPALCAAPLPRAYQWLDGSAYLSHVERVRAARGAMLPPDAATNPLMYQGDSDYFIGGCDPIEVLSEDWGIDLEAELAVVVDDLPLGATPDDARAAIRLVMLVNDVSYRNLIPGELAKGFGFLNGKGPTAFSPVAVTPDELGSAWDGATVQLPVQVAINGKPFGHPHAGREMAFDFPRLIAHAAKTRPLGAGTIVGSGTISNAAALAGYGCVSEIRAVESVQYGEARTPYLRFGDRVRIEMLDENGRSVFGALDAVVKQGAPSRHRNRHVGSAYG